MSANRWPAKSTDQWRAGYSLTRGEKVLVVAVPLAAVVATLFALLTNLPLLNVTREFMQLR